MLSRALGETIRRHPIAIANTTGIKQHNSIPKTSLIAPLPARLSLRTNSVVAARIVSSVVVVTRLIALAIPENRPPDSCCSRRETAKTKEIKAKQMTIHESICPDLSTLLVAFDAGAGKKKMTIAANTQIGPTAIVASYGIIHPIRVKSPALSSAASATDKAAVKCNRLRSVNCKKFLKRDNVRVIPDAGGVETVGADTIAKLSAQTSKDRSNAAWDQRIVIQQLRFSIGL